MLQRIVVASAALVATLLLTAASAPAESIDSTDLRVGVTVPGIREHLAALQRIAATAGGTRAMGTPGYEASVAYVRQRLAAAGYRVSTQRFQVPYFTETAMPVLFGRRGYQPVTEVRTMRYSGGGDVTAPVHGVGLMVPPPAIPSSASGCERADFTGMPRGAVALMQRGTCPFGQKARNAQAAGAAAAVIMNEGQPGRTEAVSGTVEGSGVTIPVLSVSYQVGMELAGAGQAPVHLVTHVDSGLRDTENVIADGTEGRPDRVIMVGAHLDSVPQGPGINDDGSGTATVLAIAEQLARLPDVQRNQVRFAFWGAEELGLLGSRHYVDQLGPDQRADIAAYLNFDMLGSPNFARMVYSRAAGSDAEDDVAVPPGSDALTRLFTAYFAARGVSVEPTGFDGRSDYGPFAEAGIPVGGLFSGAEEVKTPEQAARNGGAAGRPLDGCYHQACDTIDNINDQALDQLGDAAAHAVFTLLHTGVDPRNAAL
jgi:Zn-dependent M28 family amino/carboxypeptidase